MSSANRRLPLVNYDEACVWEPPRGARTNNREPSSLVGAQGHIFAVEIGDHVLCECGYTWHAQQERPTTCELPPPEHRSGRLRFAVEAEESKR